VTIGTVTVVIIINVLIGVVNYRHPDNASWNKWMVLKQQTFKFLYLQSHDADTHTHTQSHLLHTHLPKHVPNVPLAAQTIRHCLITNSFTSIELKCDICFQKQRIQKINK
jgi:hypothetical protein